MIRRVVKMKFQPEAVAGFLEMFELVSPRIRQFPGCHHLELWQDDADAAIFFTYSHWESEEFLNRYRQSELFGEVWQKTKSLFSAAPEAWSLNLVKEV